MFFVDRAVARAMRSAILVAILLITFNSAWAGSYGSFKGVVFHGCYDGDTCTFTKPGVHPLLGEKIKVRLRGVDAAEIRSKCDWEKEHAIRRGPLENYGFPVLRQEITQRISFPEAIGGVGAGQEKPRGQGNCGFCAGFNGA